MYFKLMCEVEEASCSSNMFAKLLHILIPPTPNGNPFDMSPSSDPTPQLEGSRARLGVDASLGAQGSSRATGRRGLQSLGKTQDVKTKFNVRGT